MECGEQTIYCAFEEYGLEWYSLLLFYGSPLGIWSLETMELFLFLFFACVQASFFLLDSSMPPFSKGFWGICVGHCYSNYFERPYLWVG